MICSGRRWMLRDTPVGVATISSSVAKYLLCVPFGLVCFQTGPAALRSGEHGGRLRASNQRRFSLNRARTSLRLRYAAPSWTRITLRG